MATRHLTLSEKHQLREMIDECGAPEVLRVIAQCVAHDAIDFQVGDKQRTEINRIAKALDAATA